MMRFRRCALLLLLATLGPIAQAATIAAASCSVADVQTAVDASSNGDTVTVPSGSCRWTTGLGVDGKSITVSGAGIGNTIITDGTSKGDSNCGGTQALMSISADYLPGNRVTGFTIIGEDAAFNCGESAKHISIGGTVSSTAFRVDHIAITLGVTAINVSDAVGVIDHNIFHDGADKFTTLVQHRSWKGVGNYGDNSWAQADSLGTADAVYIEDNTYDFSSLTDFPVGCFDTEAGGRLVFRHNTGCPFVGMHGLDSSGRLRSGRHYEIYNNSFTAQVSNLGNMYTGVFLRGGTGMIFNNTFADVSGSPYLNLVIVNSYRDGAQYPPWGPSYTAGACDGTGPFDTNIGTTYATGTATSGSSNDSLNDSTKTWTTDQWVAYSVRNTTAGWGSAIDANTTTNITSENPAQGSAHGWTTGDAYEIRKAYPCMDQIGRGAGNYISGDNPTTVAAISQASDPMYEWLNALNGTVQAGIKTNHPQHVAANRDFYNWNGTFNGTSGVGTGLLSDRPATCTPAVAYWGTDTTTLYKCLTTNTWTASYTPYTYPHPLIGASPGGTITCGAI